MTMKWEEFFARRAEDLAFIHLTRREDLIVDRLASPGARVDFLVTVTREGLATGRVFGVQVKARAGSVRSTAGLNRRISGVPSIADVPFPLCVFVFTMEDDRGYYGWLREPVLSNRRSPALRLVEQVAWSELDRGALAEIVHTVEAWYEAQKRSTRQHSSSPERRSQVV
jgi:hypothetical protein